MTRSTGLFVTLLCMCSTPSAAALPQGPPELVGKVWVTTDASAAPGTIRIFLPDGTLVMDSCSEGYRLVPWRRLDDSRLEWTEDTARIEARVVELSGDRLQLRLQLKGEVKVEAYRRAPVPTVCPDMPRSSGVVTPGPTTYRCGDDTFKVAFEEGRAYVTLPDGSLTTLERLETAGGPHSPRTFTNGRLTFVQENIDGRESRVLFARGRMAPASCTQVK